MTGRAGEQPADLAARHRLDWDSVLFAAGILAYVVWYLTDALKGGWGVENLALVLPASVVVAGLAATLIVERIAWRLHLARAPAEGKRIQVAAGAHPWLSCGRRSRSWVWCCCWAISSVYGGVFAVF